MIRNEFVSNSSSSSCILIDNVRDINEFPKRDFGQKTITLPTDKGTKEFGWDFVDYKTIYDKLNFCAIQLIDLKYIEDYHAKNKFKENWQRKLWNEFNKKYSYDKCLKLLKDVCLKEFNLKIDFVKINEEKRWENGFYIDHQSSVTEHKNMGMFDNYDQLHRFLASDESMICGGNDNG